MSELVLFPSPVLAIKGAVCFSCLKPADTLNRCRGCKRVFYCSSGCQRKDWKKAHKNVCPVLVAIATLDTPCEPRTWLEYRAEMWIRITAFRAQPNLKINDERILQYQQHCAACHRNIFQLPPTSNKLTLCPTCSLAHHCPSCPTTTHSSHCDTHLSVAIAERFAIKHYINTGEPNCMLFTPVPRKTYIPLSTVPDWYTYFTLISSQPNISGRVSPDTLDPIPSPEDNLEELQDTSSFLKAATDKIGMMVTILAGLEAVFPDLKDKETLTLHIIGATAKELDALMLFEELLHVLPSLKSIHTSFIGLELPSPEDNEALASLPLDCCEPCIALNRKRSMTMYKGSYIEFMRAHRIFRAPDIAVLFHTGHSQESISDWLPTIRYLGTQASHASVFTCFNKMEMTEEIEGLKGAGARFLVDGEENKWRGRRPLLEVAEEEEGSKFHMNAYWYVVAPHLTATSNK